MIKSINFNRYSNFFSLAVLVCCLVYYYFAAININYINTFLLDLGPTPDGQEYFSSAVSFIENRNFTIQIGDEFLPSRYPFGFSMLLVPIILLLGDHKAIFAPYYTNNLLGLLILTGFFLFYFLQRRYLAASLSSLLLVTLPSFILFSRSSLSENLSLFYILVLFLLSYLAEKYKSIWLVIITAFLIGLCCIIRLQMIFFFPLLAIFLKISKTYSLVSKFYCLVAIIASFLIGILPSFIYNFIYFQNPLKTGYHFWVSSFNQSGYSFNIQYVFPQLKSLLLEFLLLSSNYRVSNLFGTGVYFTPTFVILAVLSTVYFICVTYRTNWVQINTVLFSFVTLLCYYFYQDGIRLYYSVLVLSIIPIVFTFERLAQWRNITNPILPVKRFYQITSIRIVYVILLGLTIIGFPSVTGIPTKLTLSQTAELLNHNYFAGKPIQLLATQELMKLNLDNAQSVLVFSNLNPVFANSLLPNNFIVVPDNEDHPYRHSLQWKYGITERNDYLSKGLMNNDTILYLRIGEATNQEISKQLPLPSQYKWKPLKVSPSLSIHQCTRK